MTGQANNTEQIRTMLRLHETAWANFRDRRSYEWKVSFGIWTALAAFIAIALQGRVTLPPAYRGWFWLFAGFLLGFHIFFEYRIARAHKADTAKAYLYEKLLNNTLPFNPEAKANSHVNFDRCWEAKDYHCDVRKKIQDVKGWTQMGGWAHVGIHGAITLLLIVVAFFVLFSAINPSNAASTESREIVPRAATAVGKGVIPVPTTMPSELRSWWMGLQYLKVLLLPAVVALALWLSYELLKRLPKLREGES